MKTQLQNFDPLIEEFLFEKKQPVINFKTFYSTYSNETSPYKKKNSDSKYEYFKRIGKNLMNIYYGDNFAKEKKEINLAFRKLIDNNNFQEMNQFLKYGFVPDINSHNAFVNKIDRDAQEHFIFPIQKKEPIYGVLAQSLFLHSSYQIYCHSIISKLQEHFPQEILSPELFTELYDSGKMYKNVRVTNFSYDKENFIAAVHMHNLCINPQFTMPLFAHALDRMFNDDKYNHVSIEWSVGSVLQVLFPYIKPLLSHEDKDFIFNLVQKNRDKIFKKGGNNDLCIAISKFYETISSELMGSDKNNTDKLGYKEQLLQQVKHIYSNEKENGFAQSVVPLHIEEKEFLPVHKDLIKNIKHIHSKLSNCVSLLENEHIEKINHLVSETLPLTIKKYESIDVNFRESVKNIEGKNSHELFQESLTNILFVMKDIEVTVEQAKINDLSLINRKNRIK